MKTIKIHFSIDDIFESLIWLTKNNAHSIFDSYIFNAVKEIHTKYNLDVSMYCMYSNGNDSLTKISNKWKDEFLSNHDWLHFGFHCYYPDSNYAKTNISDFAKQYKETIMECKRIFGSADADILRLHYFSGNPFLTEYLRNTGIRALLYADDERVSYGVNENIHKEVNSIGHSIDSNTNMLYYKTNFRVENIQKDNWNSINDYIINDTLVFFTHEKFFKDKHFSSNIMKLLDLLSLSYILENL